MASGGIVDAIATWFDLHLDSHTCCFDFCNPEEVSNAADVLVLTVLPML